LTVRDDREGAKDYFEKLAPEYDRAFRLQGRGPLNAVVNRLFRGRTFVRRMRLLEGVFERLHLDGKSVLDVGCGSGQVSLLAASMGARVHGIDIAPGMLALAREAAERSGLSARARFVEGDVSRDALPEADVVLLVGVIEYYRDFEALIQRAAGATRQALVVAHANRVLYRMALRHAMARLGRLNLYYHPMHAVAAAAHGAGLGLGEEKRAHAFTILVFERGTRAGGETAAG
jgi:2-polyprenyl-3-methyl-5-hydroxy-6-metoxy-1,4-benzoquinol methylase